MNTLTQGGGSTLLPFGKYKDRSVDSVASEDPGYLRWAMEYVSMDQFPGLFQVIYEALSRRGELNE